MAEKLVWHTEKRKVNELVPYEQNPRQMTQKQAADLQRSLEKFNLVEIPAINTDNKIIAGHMRLKALQLLGRGDEEIEVRIPNRSLTAREFQEYNIRSNKNIGEWDWDVLANNFDIEVLKDAGFTMEELSGKFTPELDEDNFDAQKAYDAIKEPVAKLGDIYQLGNHRLMCGDSTKRDDVEKLMNGQKADMVFTDPPYNVNYSYAKYEAIGGGRKKKFLDGGKILNDNKTELDFYQFLYDVFKNIYEFSQDHMAIYVCFATKTEIPFRTAFRDAGFLFSQTIIWLKERLILAMVQDYHRVYEPIIFGWKDGSKHYKDKTITTAKELWDLDKLKFEERLDLWYISRDKATDYIHPTQKPIRLAERALNKNTKLGDLLYEPFGGSLSTLMACEKAGRRCFAMELDPAYIDVGIQRWEQYTGMKAVKIDEYKTE